MAVAKVPGKAEYGGYDPEFVGEVPEQFMCNICTKVLRDPHLTGCCGQHYCESCLTHWFKKHKSKTCPHCRENNLAHLQNKALMRQVNQLKVYCTLRKQGCEWEGELSDLQTHLDLDKGCGYVELKCPNRCRVRRKGLRRLVINRINREDLSEHLRGKCYLRKHKCEHCGHEDTYQSITGKGGPKQVTSYHYTTCPDLPLECPKKCGAVRIKRKDIPAHRDLCPLEPLECPNRCGVCRRVFLTLNRINRKDLSEHLRGECYLRRHKCEHCGHDDIPAHREQCPLEPVQCPFQEAGCETKLVRRDLEDHMVTQMQQHLLLTFQTVRMLRQENAELKQEVQALKAKSA